MKVMMNEWNWWWVNDIEDEWMKLIMNGWNWRWMNENDDEWMN